MKLRPLALAVMVALPIGMAACTAEQQPPAAPVAAVQTTESKVKQLDKMYVEYWDETLQRNPVQATFVGDNRFNDQLPNFFSPEYRQGSIDFDKKWLAKFEKIDPAGLEGQDRLSYDIMIRNLNLDLESYKFRTDLMPLNQFFNIAGLFAQLGSGTGAQPFKTVADYDNWLKRASHGPELFAQMETNMKEGVKAGMVQPKVLMVKVIPQLDALISDKPETTLFWKPIESMPKDFSDEDKARLTDAYRKLIAEQLMPAFKELRRYVNDEYLPACRDTVGLEALPDGKALYAYDVKVSTTTDMTPDQIHQIGLDEVARIHGEMQKVMDEVGFKGSLQDFFHYLDTDKRFQFKSEQDLLARYNALLEKVDAGVPNLFSVTPKAKFEIRPIESFRAKSSAGGEYQGPSEDGSRPGIFYVNTYDLPSRKTWDMEDLFLHEAIPGHHFQISLQQELKDVPAFRRFGGDTAYVEGWGLYAESLGKELGVYTDPYMYFGKLNGELWRAIRLVVDTGLHSKGWTRDQVIKYMRDNSAVSETEAVSEAERYMAIPGQALAYKIGQLTISKLRARAEQELGPKFDIREFHNQILKDGSLPMGVLETKIDRWIASQKK